MVYGVYRKDKLIGIISKAREDAVNISADKEYYVAWLSALVSSPLIDKNKIERLSINKLLKTRLYKPFTSRRHYKKPRVMKFNKVVSYAL